MNGGPLDPMTELAATAAQLHEMYCAYVDAGFAPGQALYLTAAVVSGGLKVPPDEPEPPR